MSSASLRGERVASLYARTEGSSLTLPARLVHAAELRAGSGSDGCTAEGAHKLVGVGGDYFPTRARGQPAPDAPVDRVLGKRHVAIAEKNVHAAEVMAAGSFPARVVVRDA